MNSKRTYMKRFVLLLLGGFGFLVSMAQKTVVNDPNAELRTIGSFHAIKVSDAIDLYLSPGEKEAIAVSAVDSEWRDRIKTEVVNGELRVYMERKKGTNWTSASKKMKAYIAYTQLDRLDASGASDVYVDGFITGTTLDISLSGSSDFKGAVKVGSLKLDESGSSDAQITGSVTGHTSIDASGASKVKGYDLVTETCSVNASGASDIRISVNKELNVHASGASSIYYKGDAVIRDLHTNGSSNVSKQ